uniref:Uncharacterized protein n=1 Tax=virus sp. ctBM815 TaxID=2825806 RepID=A0A8S5RJW9_9VIRU|nr:MAG TPA: hypothetical protein [virus sp. ctBM815]
MFLIRLDMQKSRSTEYLTKVFRQSLERMA